MTDFRPPAIPLIDGQLRLLIDQLAAATGTWPVTIEFGVLALTISYLLQTDRETVAQILESEAAVIRHDGVVPPNMQRHHHQLIDQLLRAHMLRQTPVRGQA